MCLNSFFFIFAMHIEQTGRKRLLLHFTTKHGSVLPNAVHVLLPKGPWYVCQRGNHRNGRRRHVELRLIVRKSSNGIRKRKSSPLLLLLYPLLSKIAVIFSVSFGTMNKPLLHVLALIVVCNYFLSFYRWKVKGTKRFLKKLSKLKLVNITQSHLFIMLFFINENRFTYKESIHCVAVK